MKNQLRLQMNLPPAYDYGSWVRHAGVEDSCDRLALWDIHGGRLWLSSAAAAGKSHLLRVFSADHAAVTMLDVSISHADGSNAFESNPAVFNQTDNNQTNCNQTDSNQLTQQWVELLAGTSCWLIDVPAGAMSQTVAHALFHLLERARDLQCAIVLAWRGDPASLPPELSSRLLAMDKISMAAPADDEALLQVLRASAGSLQWDIREQVLQAMLTYLPRQLDVLVPALKALEALSFEQKHKPGPAWVKQQLLHLSESLPLT